MLNCINQQIKRVANLVRIEIECENIDNAINVRKVSGF